MTHLTVTPEGATAPTERGFDDPDFQRCDGCDSGLIVEDPAEPWPCPFCSHINWPRPKPCSRCGGSGKVNLPSWDWWPAEGYDRGRVEGCPEGR